MSDRELEKKIKDSFEKITPDVLASVLADCEEKGQEVVMKESVITNKRPVRLRRFASLAAVFIILFGSVIGVNAYQSNKAISARVSLDVNPSVEIQVNKKERVIDVAPLNEDGKTIIGDMDFSGSDIDVAVNALVGSMMRNGYISEISNSILVTVSGKDATKDAALQARVADEIDKILAGNKVTGAILSQVLVEDQKLDNIAKEYGITAGKAKLINEIIEKNNLYTVADLVPLTINELNLLTVSNEIEFVDIKAKGQASDTAYIGNEAAEAAALKHAGATKETATALHSKLEWEHGKMVYDVEFASEGFEYEYDIDALTGEVVDFEKYVDDDYRPTTASNQTSTPAQTTPAQTTPAQTTPAQTAPAVQQEIEAAAAQEKALAHAGLTAGQVTELEVEFDYDDKEYDVSFKYGGYEYDYEIDAYTGNVIWSEKEVDDDYRPSGNSGSTTTASAPAQSAPAQSAPAPAPAQSAPAQQVIGASAAQSKALSHAGFSAGQVAELEVEYDADDGDYDVSFKAGGYEYDYEIDAYSGAIIKADKEVDD